MLNRLGRSPFLWAPLLVVAGVLLLLERLGIVGASPLWLVLIFGLGALAFLLLYLQSRDNAWAAIPAFALLGLAGLVGWANVGPPAAAHWGPSLLLGGIGLGFFALYLADHEGLWAIVPGGVLLTIAGLVGLSESLEGLGGVAFLFFGVALTFVLLTVAPTEEQRERWPLAVSGVLGVLGVLFAIEATAILEVLTYLWPVALIVAGLWLVLRAFFPG